MTGADDDTTAEPWLVERLVHTAGLDRAAVEGMAAEEALDARADYRNNRSGSDMTAGMSPRGREPRRERA